MNGTDYKDLYEREVCRRLEAEQKLNELNERVKTLIETIERMSESARRIEEVMQEFAKLQKAESQYHSGPEDPAGD